MYYSGAAYYATYRQFIAETALDAGKEMKNAVEPT
jgi:hypothetical protein